MPGMLSGCKRSTHKLLDMLQHEEVCWILWRPTPPAQRKPPQVRCSAHVLTSEHCMQELQDREETKRMKQEEKERKGIECEECKKVKEAQR